MNRWGWIVLFCGGGLILYYVLQNRDKDVPPGRRSSPAQSPSLPSRSGENLPKPDGRSVVKSYTVEFEEAATRYFIHLDPAIVRLEDAVAAELERLFPKNMSKPVVDMEDIQKRTGLPYKDTVFAVRAWLHEEAVHIDEGDAVRDVLSDVLLERAKSKAKKIVADHVSQSGKAIPH